MNSMREKRSLEKIQFPESVYEAWLHSQKAGKEGKKHRNPTEDLYEAWIRKRVEDAVLEPHHRRGHGRPAMTTSPEIPA